MKQQRASLFVLSLFILLYILPLGMRPMFVPDEVRYAEVPREMIASGDWVVPRLNGLRYFEKPVLGYWLTAGSMLLFGENSFAVRFPSALYAGLTALLVFLFARGRLPESDLSAPLAAMTFLTCFEVAGVGTFAVLDTMLSFFLTGSMVFFFYAMSALPGSWRERGHLSGAGVFCGLAFLVKGFLAFLVPALAVGGYLLWNRRFRDLLRLPWLPLSIAVLVVLPWGIMIHGKEPDFWHYFFWNEHVRRFMGSNAQHGEPFWYFLAVSPAMFLPWTFVVPAAFSGLKKNLVITSASKETVRFCLCWMVLPFLFFSISSGKLLTYILPCFPPFALLLAQGISRNLRNGTDRFFRMGATGAAIFFALLFIVLIGVQFAGFNGLRPYHHTWKWLWVANSLALGVLLCIVATQCGKYEWSPFLLGIASVSLLFTLQFTMPDQTLESKAPGLLLQRHLHDVRPETLIISEDEPVRAVCWFFKRDDVFLLEKAGELEYGIGFGKNRDRLLKVEQADRMILQNRDRIVLILRKEHYDLWKKALPTPVDYDDNGADGYVFVKY